MTTLKRLLSNKTVWALAIGATVMTSCSKQDLQHEEQLITPADDTESKISALATPGLTAFRFTEIPVSSIDIQNPGRGAEQWHDRTDVNVPQEGVNTAAMDVYYRFVWTRLEGATQGSYNWAYFDGLVNAAINKKQKMSFGIMTVLS